jgi:hypothetical protein
LKKILIGITTLILTVLLSTAGHANTLSTTAVQLNVSTEGIGGTLTTAIIPGALNINLGVSRFNYGAHFSADGTRFKGDATLGAVPITLSYYPLGGGLSLSAGLIFNQNSVKVSGQPEDGTFTINHVTYTAAQVDHLDGKTHFNAVAPYIGIGWGNPVSAGSPWDFVVNAGAMYEGNTSVSLSASGVGANPAIARDVKETQDEVNNKLNFLNWWPVVSMGVSYRF